MSIECIVEAKSGISLKVNKGELIEIVDLFGEQVVDFFAFNQESAEEYLSAGVTIDCNESLKVSVGDVIYTNHYNKMFTIIEDDVKEHDLLHPCCRPEMYDFFYGNEKDHSNCLENINNYLIELFSIKKEEIRPFNIFMYTKILSDGSISVEKPLSKPGEKIILRAEMDVQLAVAACSVSESDCNGGNCTPVKIIIR
ncbi:urea carboxylase-associated family protein [Miniphocaeibacter halophilus]|uniref:Urea carboxylase-associated family protein n=1 Tax=Miniphocaeibacter halophilus TaxID=2931922 RepID=A0AC61MTU7_9FIRM|nr:urea carboxylase-associated family protein [Miniphocaeibacter halophilus]